MVWKRQALDGSPCKWNLERIATLQAQRPEFRQKLAFYREGYDWHTEPQPRLKVTGKRLDSPAPPLLSDHATYGWAKPEQTAMVTGINFPTLGCWEITGHYQDDELTFVVWVAK